MKTAAYARYSTDKQSESSIDDQFRNCAKHGTIDLKFSDAGISGCTRDRHGYQAMLAAATDNEFNTLIVDDLSRLARDHVEQEQTIRRLEFMGIRILSVSDGYDSGMALGSRKMLRGIKGLVNENYIDEIAQKVHRGLTGKALNGNNCGGRSYGYHHIPVEDPTKTDTHGRPVIDHVHREVDSDQASVIVEIFKWYAGGRSPLWIAKKLNRRGTPAPRGRSWARTTIYGHNKKGTGILNNPLYIGQYIWNRSRWVRDPDTRVRKRIERPESEWIIQHNETIRIIHDDLWARVKARQAATVNPQGKSGGRGPGYLFSGLMVCNECGRNYVMVNRYQYGCAGFKERGTCGNQIKVRRDVAEACLLTGIQQDLATDEGISLYQAELRKALKAMSDDGQLNRTRARIKALDTEITNMVQAVRSGAVSPALTSAITASENEREALQQDMDAAPSLTSVEEMVPRAADMYRDMLADLSESLKEDVPAAREQIRELIIQPIRLVPEEGTLIAEIVSNFGGAVAESKINMVAGVGFEPTTFGL